MKRIFPLLLVLMLAPISYASVSTALSGRREAYGWFSFYDLSYAHYLVFYHFRDEFVWGMTAFSVVLLLFWGAVLIHPAKTRALNWATSLYAVCVLAANTLALTAGVAFVLEWERMPSSLLEFLAAFDGLPLGWILFLVFALAGIPLMLAASPWLHCWCLLRGKRA
ncbi:hypothetical protein [Spongiibacter tropicus]|uniref:hypothetical protein n=1 Tax=Spongiibacter tropicus TaxID=454602 RepID=UPI0023557C57|nr:hypothetical protein [Spongiibacter tropicus]